MITRQTILVLVGPTASGKSDVSLHLARLLNGEIISADSRQVYKYLDIGTAKPGNIRGIPHHFVDERTPDQDFSAGEFGMLGRELIRKIFRRGRLPIVVGGSGLYVRSLIDGIFDGPGADTVYRKTLEGRIRESGIAGLLEELRAVDPGSARTIDPTKPRRVIRALEVYRATGKPISLLHKVTAPSVDFQSVQFGLLWERKELYQRIEARCDDMIARGLLEEVEGLERRRYTDALNALRTVGYAEAFAYRRGKISYDEMVRLFKQNSRRYAKRQMTWFRRDSRIEWIGMSAEKSEGQVARDIAARFRRVAFVE